MLMKKSRYSTKKALEYYSFGAMHGSPVAQYNLALDYKNGGIVPQDHVLALHWFSKSLYGYSRIEGKDKYMKDIIGSINHFMTDKLLMDLIISKEELQNKVDELNKVISQQKEQIDVLQTEVDYRPSGKGSRRTLLR